MTAGLKVISPGPHSTIQDLGRVGYRDAGIPLSGPLDRVASTLANTLAGNEGNAPVIEFLLQGPILEVMIASVRVAVMGGSFAIEGKGRVGSGRSLCVERGDRIACGLLGEVSCGYLAVEGGIDVPRVLGSASTYVRSRIGGLHGEALHAGDVLPVTSESARARPETALRQPFDPELAAPIRVVLGPQHDHFTAEAIATLLSAPYTISPQADRMGFRLQGPSLAHARGYDIVSDGIVPGSVQVPGSGQPIVLLADAQTTGGYPKIATVISADLPVIGRRRPGSSVRFAAVTQEEAETARRAQERLLERCIGEMHSAIEPAALYTANLVGGVSDGTE
jgi:allophanate hydrolase